MNLTFLNFKVQTCVVFIFNTYKIIYLCKCNQWNSHCETGSRFNDYVSTDMLHLPIIIPSTKVYLNEYQSLQVVRQMYIYIYTTWHLLQSNIRFLFYNEINIRLHKFFSGEFIILSIINYFCYFITFLNI